MWINLNISFWKIMTFELVNIPYFTSIIFQAAEVCSHFFQYVSSDSTIHTAVGDNVCAERRSCDSNANLIQNLL